MKCSWCGKEAAFKLKNGKFCCSEKVMLCPSFQSNSTYAKKIKTNKMCSYGCGQKAHFIYSTSKKFCCSERLQSCPGIRNKNAKSNSIAKTGSNNPMFGKKHSDETKKKQSQTVKKQWKDPNSIFNSEQWKKNLGKAMNARPNYPEQQILNFLNEYLPGKFEYTGDHAFWIGRKNPDFVDTRNKKVIDFFGQRFHEESEEETRTTYFKQRGYETLIIWERDFRNNIEKVHKRIIEFGG